MKKKYVKKINSWFKDVIEILKNVLVFAIICGLLFNDPFGIITTINNLIIGVGEDGIVGLISLLIVMTLYRR